MIKKVSIIILIILCVVGGMVVMSDVFNSPPPYVPLSDITHGFTFDDAKYTWTEDSKKLNFSQKVYTPHNKDLEDIGVKIDFYNGKTHVGYKYVHIDKSINGTFDVNFTTELSEQPTKYTSEVVKSKEI